MFTQCCIATPFDLTLQMLFNTHLYKFNLSGNVYILSKLIWVQAFVSCFFNEAICVSSCSYCVVFAVFWVYMSHIPVSAVMVSDEIIIAASIHLMALSFFISALSDVHVFSSYNIGIGHKYIYYFLYCGHLYASAYKIHPIIMHIVYLRSQ
jgi:hypothetical protein